MATVLEVLNNSIRLVGEQELLDSNSTLGALARTCLQTAVDDVISKTRHQAFISLTTTNVTQADYLLPAAVLPIDMVQLLDVFIRTADSPPRLIKLKQEPLTTLDYNFGYNVTGGNIYVGVRVARPFTLLTRLVSTVPIGTDASTLAVPDVCLPAIQHTVASLLAVSFVDDANNAAMHKRAAEEIVKRIRDREGLLSTTSMNMRGNY